MLFNSFVFIFLFLPIVFTGYYLLNHFKQYKASLLWLVAGSLFFYGYFEPRYLILITTSIAVNFSIGHLMNRTDRIGWKKVQLTIGILFNVSLLGYYKYADFFLSNANSIFGTDYVLLHLILPLGLSFITFQKIAYLVDTYRGETRNYNLPTFALFATFFPQLIAGPIVHHKEVIPQFENEKNKRIIWDNISMGVFIFIIGLAKKVAIADTVALWANDGFSNYQNLTFIESWVTSLAYTIQLYFDFSGYCDMAIGLGLLFNIRLPINFNSPYKSRNIQDFWKRWHMTLGRFMTQYIYIPLGGNRRGKILTYVNVFIIFFISGFWHGAGWTFIVWGIMHGVASIIVRMWGNTKITLPYWVSWFITFQFVNVAWVYFRATSIEQANVIIGKMFSPNWSEFSTFFTHPIRNFAYSSTFELPFFTINNPKVVVFSLIVLLLFAFSVKNSVEWIENFKPKWSYIVASQVLLLLVLTSVFLMQKNNVFLYFNF
ncbi:MBOAT family O-acyltransferase [Bacillus sp. AK031]